MTTMLHGQLHYRCAIDLESLVEGQDDWRDLVKRVRTWLAKVAKVDSKALAAVWFYKGDRWKQGCPQAIHLETCQAQLTSGSEIPTHWGCRIEHPCGEHSACRW